MNTSDGVIRSLFSLLTLVFLFVEAGQSHLFNLVFLLDDVLSANKTQTEAVKKYFNTKIKKLEKGAMHFSTMDRVRV